MLSSYKQWNCLEFHQTNLFREVVPSFFFKSIEILGSPKTATQMNAPPVASQQAEDTFDLCLRPATRSDNRNEHFKFDKGQIIKATKTAIEERT